MPATFVQALEVVTRVLARDLACKEGELHLDGVWIAEAREVPGRRRFPFTTPSLLMATLGRGAVIACNRERIESIRNLAEGFSRDDLFSAAGMWLLQELVSADQQVLLGPQVKHVCTSASLRPCDPPKGYDIDLVDRAGVLRLFELPGFAHALTHVPDSPRPDTMATVATCEGEVVGIAGVAADCEELWQMGIEVVPEHQDKGLAKVLVSQLARAILDDGRIPYYSTELGNIRSSALATSIGFRPAWLEAFTNSDPMPQQET